MKLVVLEDGIFDLSLFQAAYDLNPANENAFQTYVSLSTPLGGFSTHHPVSEVLAAIRKAKLEKDM